MGGLLFRALDDAARPGNRFRVLRLQRGALGLAALTGPEAGRLGISRAGMEGDVARVGEARGARRPAIDAGCLHGVVETSVRAMILRDDCRPTGVCFGARDRCFLKGGHASSSTMSLRFAENDIRAKEPHPGACFQIEKGERGYGAA